MSFFLVAALVYFSMHALVWVRTCRQMGLSRKTGLVGWLIALFLTLTPFLAHFIPSTWPQPLVRSAWWLVFLWMGIVFYLFWLHIAGGMLAFLARLLPPAWTGWLPRGKRQSRVILLVTLLTVGYGLLANMQWRVPRLVIPTPHISRDIRVVLISDTHFGVMTRQAWVERLTSFVSELKPDLVLFAGDQVNDHPDWLEPKALALSKLQPSLGVYGVLGNHESYVGLEASQEFHDLAGIRLLRNETLIIPESGIQLLGVDDPAWGFKDQGFMVKIVAGLEHELLPDHFSILIAHRPWGWEEKAVPLGIDLMVAGHTHGGQMFPFNWFVRLHYKHVAGHFQRDGSHLYVTTGARTWGPPLRVGTRPEIVIIDLTRD